MSKAEDTRQDLMDAIDRIMEGKPLRVPLSRKLSVKAVEDEASLGDGTAYYYRDVVDRVKILKAKRPEALSTAGVSNQSKDRVQLGRERKLKSKYRNQIRVLSERLSSMAAIHNSLALRNRELARLLDECRKEIRILKSSGKPTTR